LLFGALQGALLSAWLLWNRQRKFSYVYLALLLIVVGLQLTFKVITKTWVMDFALFSYLMSYKLPYLIGPLVYLFVSSQAIHQQKKWRNVYLLHFVPFVVFTAIAYWLAWEDLHPYAHAAMQTISLWTYTYLSVRTVVGPMRKFAVVVASAETIIIITLAVMYIYYGQFPDVRLLFIILTLLIYWISYGVLSSSTTLFQSDTNVVPLKTQRNVKYARSSLKREEGDRIEKELQMLMLEQKLFADMSITVDMLAAKLQTSRHHLSQVINERMRRSYADYICDLRLEEARRKLIDPANFRYTIAGIAMDAGFNSVSTFNEAFKRQFNTTPSKYREQVLKEKSA
ncbi:MAG TPA: helix-turn-helix domain-containing protein, partial [Chryseolinea sp.]|nr:helix-turn-helix domain-containing protein [Chryseolinea sp.]